MEFSHHGKITTGIHVWKEVTFERVWEIQNFDLVVRNDELLENQKFVLETSQIPGTSCTWLIGLQKLKLSNIIYTSLYCQLSKVSGGITIPIQARISTAVENPHQEGEIPISTHDVDFHLLKKFHLGRSEMENCVDCLQSNRSLILKVRLTLKRRFRAQVLREDYQPEPMTDSQTAFLGKLVCDEVTSDVKIITGDGVELPGHKMILQMKNDVFASSLQSDFREGNTGIINVTDINAQTMRIILQYIYTGELSPEWSDAENIVEFMYAAGKYQLTEVLKLLDYTLGFKCCAKYRTVYFPLLNLAGKLSLQNAERNLLKEISELTGKIKTAQDFFALVVDQAETVLKAESSD